MSRSLIDALPSPCRQFARKPTLRSNPRRSSGMGCFLLMPLLMCGCVYHHPPMPVQKAAFVLPKPAPRLLAELPVPKCTYTDEEPAAASSDLTAKAVSSGSISNAGSTAAEQAKTAALEETVQRRERERDCFRDAEARVRARLNELQSSVRVMMQAMNKQKRNLASAR